MVTLQGSARIGKAPTLKYVGDNNDKPVCEFSVRMLSFRKSKTEADQLDDKGFWANISIWGKFAEAASKQFSKGDRIFIADADIYQDTYRYTPANSDQEEDGSSFQINCSLVFPWTPDLEAVTFKPRRGADEESDGQD